MNEDTNPTPAGAPLPAPAKPKYTSLAKFEGELGPYHFLALAVVDETENADHRPFWSVRVTRPDLAQAAMSDLPRHEDHASAEALNELKAWIFDSMLIGETLSGPEAPLVVPPSEAEKSIILTP